MAGVLILASAVYLGVGLPMTLLQRHLLYWPARTSLAEAEATAAEMGLSPWRNGEGETIGWEAANALGSAGNVLITHGVDGCALDRATLALLVRRTTGLPVFVLEYPGYGARDGSPGEKNFLAAADDAWKNLPHGGPTYIISESLGAGVAAHLAQEHPKEVAGLLMFVPYDRLTSVAQSHLPFLPASLLLWDRFAPADWLAEYRGPVKIVIGGADRVIPPEFGRRLYDEYNGPKSLELVPGAGHADTMRQPAAWWRAAFEFLRAPASPPRPAAR